MQRTISAMVGKGSVNHNSRKFRAENVDGSNRNNLLVIEFKKKNAETYDKENDRNKLMYLTDQKEDFKYNFGLFVELGSHEVYMEVYQEGNLQTKLNYSITY